ncbi:MAG: hypothetical protein NTV98_01180 [Candidatus Roizmanbacteria bacterium]|nr:hypothetical protein [Candidatus Roizmanbacteria bacterium]
MSVQEKVKSMLIWGFILWLIGYIAGFILFFVVPKAYIGWVITPFATILTIWVLIKKIKRPELMCYFGTGLVWMLMAIALDYLCIVKLLKTGTSYYKPDVLLYYVLTFVLPPVVGYWKYKNESPKAKLF